jgi:hypothetical protein
VPDNGDDNPQHEQKGGRRPPENPAPHLRPQGFLRDQGDAYGRKSRSAPVDRQPSTPPQPLSEKDRKAEHERGNLRHLQVKGLQVITNEHKAKLEQSRKAFDEQHRDEIAALQKERQAIMDRRSGGVRGTWNQLSGRAAHDDERLQRLDHQEQRLEEKREKYLEPLQEDQRDELASFVEVQQYERENLEYRIQREIYGNADRSNTNEHDASEHDAGELEAGRDSDDEGRSR